MGSFVTGNMDYLRRPFVRNVKPGHRILILSDTAHDPRVWQVVQSACCELGAEVTPGLHEAELHYLRESEWARCADDVTGETAVPATPIRPPDSTPIRRKSP